MMPKNKNHVARCAECFKTVSTTGVKMWGDKRITVWHRSPRGAAGKWCKGSRVPVPA